MGRKRKNSAFDSSVPSEPEEVEAILEEQDENVVEMDLEEQHETPRSLIDKARGIMSNGISGAQEKFGTDGKQKRARKPWVSKEKRDEQSGRIATLVTSIFIMLVAGWQVPDELKPSEEEINAVSGFSTSILLRHVDISGRLTADVIDVIGIIGITAAYVTRTSVAWRNYRLTQEANKAVPLPQEVKQDEPIITTPPALSPAL